MIPTFDAAGRLPPGIHGATWDEIQARFGWTPRRRRLLRGLHRGILALQSAGCSRLYLDGSFVTDKPEPGDFDACWDPVGVRAALLDPVLLDLQWPRQAQKRRFSGEFFLANVPAEPAGTLFLDFFQKDKVDGKPKGIIALDLGGIP